MKPIKFGVALVVIVALGIAAEIGLQMSEREENLIELPAIYIPLAEEERHMLHFAVEIIVVDKATTERTLADPEKYFVIRGDIEDIARAKHLSEVKTRRGREKMRQDILHLLARNHGIRATDVRFAQFAIQ